MWPQLCCSARTLSSPDRFSHRSFPRQYTKARHYAYALEYADHHQYLPASRPLPAQLSAHPANPLRTPWQWLKNQDKYRQAATLHGLGDGFLLFPNPLPFLLSIFAQRWGAFHHGLRAQTPTHSLTAPQWDQRPLGLLRPVQAPWIIPKQTPPVLNAKCLP